jgi:mannosyltransferase OCH1-like enzyme
MNKIPKRFIRIWLGEKQMPSMFEKWWDEFKVIHPDYEFVTITNNTDIELPSEIKRIYNDGLTYAGQSDILRIVALYLLGGIYVDTDMMPLKSFDDLIENDSRAFIGLRSKKSFESAVIGGCKGDKVFKDVLDALPEWYEKHKDKSCSVRTGPAFVSSVMFGRDDVRHYPIKYFYPYNGFGAPKRDVRIKMFEDKNNFPKEMYAAHFGNHRWGGKAKPIE